ncbi:MAG: dTDP-4-dehydrorhamnose 3,5-epimerase [Hellea sp.]|nr:dTDP-4-dehydrorhamnose 3,5-epimerase [Hellea sp.]
MEFESTKLGGVFLVKPPRFGDDRGFFSETFRHNLFTEKTGANVQFVQDNFSYSKHRGTVRGLHYQAPPFAQGKLVRCSRGEIMDVAVDTRPGSSTYGQHVGAKLTADNGHQLWVPAGFLHGFATLTDDCEVAYKVTNYYSKECDGNVLWNDPALGIDWGITDAEAVLSDKDKVAPLLADWTNPF